MEGRGGGCCIARLPVEADVASKVGRIMLRFRPIAPKPGAPGSGGAKLEEGSGGGGSASAGNGRKRRGISSSGGGGSGGSGKDGGGGGRRGRKKRGAPAAAVPAATGSTSSSSEEEVGSVDRAVAKRPEPITLPLLPETPERKEGGGRAEVELPSPLASSDLSVQCSPPPWYGVHKRQHQQQMSPVPVVAPIPVRPGGSSAVMVDCVTEDSTWEAAEEQWKWLWWCKEAEARKRLEGDSWPAFVSDAGGRVTWTNAAYRRMVGMEGEEDGGRGEEGGVRVALVTRGMVGRECRLFTCRVRLKYASRREKGSLTAPCDVWRLADGGLAWRLDVDAALSLRR